MNICEIALNRNTSPEILVSLSTHESWKVRWRVAANPSTPVETLKIFATDKYIAVRSMLYNNRNATEEILLMVMAKEYQLTKPLLQLAQ
jgi:hypothetical protein